MLNPAAEEAAQADIFVIIGTSLVVYPAASLVQFVPAGSPIYLIDPNAVSTNANVIYIKKGASEGMKELLKQIHP
jgi:NAD-dependent deacetylase